MSHKQYVVLSVFLALVILAPLSFIPGTADTASAAGTDSGAAQSNGWESLSSGASIWYALHYAGDRSQIELRLQVIPEGSATLAVYTPEQMQRMAGRRRVEPVGRASSDPHDPGTLLWSGSFPTAGDYSVVVERTAGQTGTSYYLLEVSGSGVSLTKTTKTAEPAVVVRSQPNTAMTSKLTGKLVFQTTYGGPFYTINVDGTVLRRITNGIDPVWSPDGQQIAFVRWDDPRGVWVVNADGSGERRVFDWTQTRWPSWSADGSEILFTRQHGTVPTSKGGGSFGMTIQRRPPGPPSGGAGTPAWTLGVVNVNDGSFWEPQPNADNSYTPDWSPAGDLIVFDGLFGLQVQSADGKESYQLTSDWYDTTPVWSPDGKKVAFARRQHDHWEIYVVDADGGNVRRLTSTPTLPDGTAGSSVSPAWSPDGKSIAFLTNRTGEWEIWVMGADGSSPGPMFGTELDGLTLAYAFAGERAISWTQ
jgi:Tol biopolymer transport system component